jgi:hypothetical protein
MDRRWTEKSVDKMLRIYGHTELVALTEVDALYARLRDAPSVRAADLRDAEVTHTGRNPRSGGELNQPRPSVESPASAGLSVRPRRGPPPQRKRRGNCATMPLESVSAMSRM